MEVEISVERRRVPLYCALFSLAYKSVIQESIRDREYFFMRKLVAHLGLLH